MPHLSKLGPPDPQDANGDDPRHSHPSAAKGSRFTSDRPQAGRVLYCLARQMIDLQRYREALDLAQTGVYAIRRSSTPKTMALLHVIEARAHAGMGQTPDCTRALGAAQDAFAQAGKHTDPAWCAFFEEGGLYGLLGVTLRDLALAVMTAVSALALLTAGLGYRSSVYAG